MLMILQHKDYFKSCVWESKVEFYLSSIRRFVNEVHSVVVCRITSLCAELIAGFYNAWLFNKILFLYLNIMKYIGLTVLTEM